MPRNNLFSFATSELSQDAFIGWLMSFALPEHEDEEPQLADCARELLRLMVGHDRQNRGACHRAQAFGPEAGCAGARIISIEPAP